MLNHTYQKFLKNIPYLPLTYQNANTEVCHKKITREIFLKLDLEDLAYEMEIQHRSKQN